MTEKWYRSEEISAMILGKLKADAEAKLGEIAGIGLNVPSRAVLQTGARIVTVVGPSPSLEGEAAKIHQEFWPKHLGKA